MMRAAIVHYHLQPGGVTRIIEHSVRSLADKPVEVVVVTGKPPAYDFPGKWRVVEGLQYERDRPEISVKELASGMLKAAVDALGAPPDIWHVHNHSLGKNIVLPGALRTLAEQGHRLLLHTHDFAEDGRPANYRHMLNTIGGGRVDRLSCLLYPSAPHVHYVVLNNRDRSFLREAGADRSTIHQLANPVDLGLDCLPETEDINTMEPLWIYPTRAIRRKNIGEFLLWAATAPRGYRFATSMAPENPLQRPRYERWKQVAAGLGLPVEFERGSKRNIGFVDLLKQARGLMTTSIAEGFGLAFMEPWLVGRTVMGRVLPEITDEFCSKGVKLPWVYERIAVPLEWLGGRERLMEVARDGLARYLSFYGRIPGKDDHERLEEAWIREGSVDFGCLDEELQVEVLARVSGSAADAAYIGEQLSYPDEVGTVITDNCSILSDHYSLPLFGKRLHALYENLAASPVQDLQDLQNLDGEILLDRFLAPERLRLIQVD